MNQYSKVYKTNILYIDYKQMKIQNVAIGVIAVMAIFSTLAIQQAQQVQAQNVFQAGWNSGKNDRMDGNTFNDVCPSELTSDAQCVSYKGGYFGGWNTEGVLHGNDQPRDTEPDFTDRDAQQGGDNNNDDN